MHLLELAVSLFAPHTCLGCGAEEDRLLCEACVATMPRVPSRCYRCKAVTTGSKVCRDCRRRTPLDHVVVFTYHEGLAKELIHRMKYERAQAGLLEAAALLAPGLDCLPPNTILTHVPTASSRVRQRGYDHARILARALAAHTALPSAVCLARLGQAHQVGASRAGRLRQLEGAFRPVRCEAFRGQHVVLVDDVLTTGATLEVTAYELKRAGAQTVSAVVFAQA